MKIQNEFKYIQFANLEALHKNLGRKLDKKQWPLEQLKNVLFIDKKHRNLPIQIEAVTEVSKLPLGSGMLNEEFAFKLSVNNDGSALIVYLYKLDPLLLAKKREKGLFLINLRNPEENKSYFFQIAKDQNHGGLYLDSFIRCPVELQERQLIYQCSYIDTEFNLNGIRMKIIGINGLISESHSFKMRLSIYNPTLEKISKDLLKQSNIITYTDFLEATQHSVLEYLSKNGAIGEGVNCWFE